MSFIVKNTTIISPLDLIAPHSCRGCGAIGSVLCDRCKKYIHEHNHKNTPPSLYAVGKREGLLSSLIHDYKYNSVRAIGPVLAELLNDVLPKIEGPVIIVPLPTIPKHIRSRGLDHTKRISKHLARLNPNFHAQLLLERNYNTVQVGTDRATRSKQAKSAYALKPHTKIDPAITYLLLDNVWTTGASMRAAINLLKNAGAKKIVPAVLAIS